MLGLDIGKCNGQPDTCVAVQQAMEADKFYEAVCDIETNAADIREMLGDFVTACANGTCPGRNLELTKHLLRDFIDPENDSE